MPKPLTVPGVETQSDSDSSLSLIPCVLSVPGWLMVKITLSDCWLPLSPHGPKYPYSLNVQVLSSCEILIMVLTVLQIPLWLDFGLVSQSSWSSCFCADLADQDRSPTPRVSLGCSEGLLSSMGNWWNGNSVRAWGCFQRVEKSCLWIRCWTQAPLGGTTFVLVLCFLLPLPKCPLMNLSSLVLS